MMSESLALFRRFLQWLRNILRGRVSRPLNIFWILVGFIQGRWRIQRKKTLNVHGHLSSQGVEAEARSIIHPSELPTVLVSQEVASSSISQRSHSSQSTFDQNGGAFLVPPTSGDGPQVAPSLLSASDVPEEANIALNANQPSRLVDTLPHEANTNTPLTPGFSGGFHLSWPMTMPEPMQTAPTSPSLRVNWGDPPRPSERISRQIIPVPAQSIMRYNRKVRIRSSDSRYTISPGTKEFVDPHRHNLGEWEPCTHPEGAIYFRHPSQRICTDANLYKHRNMDVITHCANALLERIKTTGIEYSEDSELVLEIMDDKRANLWRCGYYFVDHVHRCLFWLDPYQAEPIFGNVRGVKSPSHVKYAVEAQYWMHCELFPSGRIITRAIWEDIKLTLLHATSETITSDTSLAPFDREELGRMLDLTNDLEGSIGTRHAHAVCVLARFLRIFARTRFFNFCGQVGARLDVDQTVYYNHREGRSVLLTFLSPFLFGAPDIHAEGLHHIWVDQLVNHISWKRFIDKLNSEWQEFTLYSTVVLNANVAFLAISDINYAAQVSSYVSIVCSVGAIVLGLLLVRQNRTKGRGSAEEAVSFMTRMTYSMFGTDTLAVLYSMPFALLMWGMIFFVLGFSFLAFQAPDLITRASVGAAAGFVAVFVFWVVWASWENRLPQYWIYFLRFINARRRRSPRRRSSRPPDESGSVTSDVES